MDSENILGIHDVYTLFPDDLKLKLSFSSKSLNYIDIFRDNSIIHLFENIRNIQDKMPDILVNNFSRDTNTIKVEMVLSFETSSRKYIDIFHSYKKKPNDGYESFQYMFSFVITKYNIYIKNLCFGVKDSSYTSIISNTFKYKGDINAIVKEIKYFIYACKHNNVDIDIDGYFDLYGTSYSELLTFIYKSQWISTKYIKNEKCRDLFTYTYEDLISSIIDTSIYIDRYKKMYRQIYDLLIIQLKDVITEVKILNQLRDIINGL